MMRAHFRYYALTRWGLPADRLNQRFIILCEACIPLYPPALLYMQVLHENKSRVPMDGFTETEYAAALFKPWHTLSLHRAAS